MTAPTLVSKPITPDDRPCCICYREIQEDLSEDLSKRVTMALNPDTGELRFVHAACIASIYVAREDALARKLCGRCGQPKAGPRRMHGIDGENYLICQDNERSDSLTPFVDPYPDIAEPGPVGETGVAA